jgi:hypothetical protein
MAAIDLNTIRSTIESRVEAELKKAPPVPVVFHNTSYTPTPHSSWCQCLISFGNSSYQTLGGSTDSTNKLPGAISLNIYTPTGKGSGGNLKIGNRLRDLFNRIIVSGVSFDAPIGPEFRSNPVPEGYFQTQIRVTFDVYEAL